jgi:hypothetical protein
MYKVDKVAVHLKRFQVLKLLFIIDFFHQKWERSLRCRRRQGTSRHPRYTLHSVGEYVVAPDHTL